MTAHALLVSPLYVGLACLMIVALALVVSLRRNKFRVGLGDGSQITLLQAIRAHGNFTEYVPLALLAIVVLEATGESRYIIHALGIALIVGRLCHAVGLLSAAGQTIGRRVGTSLTWGVLIVSGILLIWQFVVATSLIG
jgi:uncharacterized membrane protein YecN with MAPEG domain